MERRGSLVFAREEHSVRMHRDSVRNMSALLTGIMHQVSQMFGLKRYVVKKFRRVYFFLMESSGSLTPSSPTSAKIAARTL